MSAWWRGPAIPLALVAVGGTVWWAASPDPEVGPAPAAAVADPTFGDFTLDTSDGPLALSDLRGRAVIVYFGYTACPDVCPTTMASVAAAYQQLPEAARARATALLVSVDPARDEVGRLGEYVRWFDPAFLAGTRPEPEIGRIAADWGVRYRKVDLDGSAMGYAVDHTTDAYLVAPDGAFVRTLPHGMPAPEMAGVWAGVLAGAPAPGG